MGHMCTHGRSQRRAVQRCARASSMSSESAPLRACVSEHPPCRVRTVHGGVRGGGGGGALFQAQWGRSEEGCLTGKDRFHASHDPRGVGGLLFIPRDYSYFHDLLFTTDNLYLTSY